MTSSTGMTAKGYTTRRRTSGAYDPELEPYMSLFMKPFSRKKCEFTRHELELMCRDPQHSPRLIRYLIDFVKGM
ncbi:MAG: hypothetical protein ACM3H7_03425 [Acidobacteriaceae bacterium]